MIELLFFISITVLIVGLVLVNRLYDFMELSEKATARVSELEYIPPEVAVCHVCSGTKWVEGTQVSWTQGFWKLMEACKDAGYTYVSIQERCAEYQSIPETNQELLKYFPKMGEPKTLHELGFFVSCEPCTPGTPAIWKIVEDLKMTNNFAHTEQPRGFDYATVHHWTSLPQGRWKLQPNGKWLFREF